MRWQAYVAAALICSAILNIACLVELRLLFAKVRFLEIAVSKLLSIFSGE
jgi:hypothetical protein